ncbi:MAG: hypothetical protein NZT92_07535 [Abditibacteriales bacterium]|nr:hypothetical protein [Abditibacteriales bacterium]MDW8365802.1 hypothetical protein [Abditibacteriales bacterium]
MKTQIRNAIVVVVVVLAVIAAVWSGMRSFGGQQGKAVGSLGDLSRDREAGAASQGMTTGK